MFFDSFAVSTIILAASSRPRPSVADDCILHFPQERFPQYQPHGPLLAREGLLLVGPTHYLVHAHDANTDNLVDAAEQVRRVLQQNASQARGICSVVLRTWLGIDCFASNSTNHQYWLFRGAEIRNNVLTIDAAFSPSADDRRQRHRKGRRAR